MNLQNEMKKLNAKHEKEIDQLRLECKITNELDNLGVAANLKQVFLHNLYGSNGNITFGNAYRHDECVTIEGAQLITEALPPLPMQYMKGNYRYFVPQEYADEHEASLSSYKREEITESWPVAPFRFELDAHGSSVKYFTKLDGKIYTVEINVATSNRYGALTMNGDVRYYGNSAKISRIENQYPKHESIGFRSTTVPINDGDRYLTEFAEPIQYASGSPENWKRVVLYAHDSVNGDVNIANFLSALYNERTN